MLQDIFRSDENYQKCRGVVKIADDINVFGTESTHDCNLHKQLAQFLNVVYKKRPCDQDGFIFSHI